MGSTTIAILILVLGSIALGLFLMAMTYPEYYARLGKYLFRAIKGTAPRTGNEPAGVVAAKQEVKKPKVKKLSPIDIVAEQIEHLAPGQTLKYKVPEAWGGDFITVELNPDYGQKGKKYNLGLENIIKDKPGGKKSSVGDSEKAREVAKWVVDRHGELYTEVKETPIVTEKVPAPASIETTSGEKVAIKV